MKEYVIVDIDGTIADIQHMARFPFTCEQDKKDFQHACETCLPHSDVIELIKILHFSGKSIVFCTARPAMSFYETRDWLRKHLPFLSEELKLFMRPEGENHLSDSTVKLKLMLINSFTPQNTFLVLEDKDCVVETWRDFGFRCLQVG